MQTSKTFFLATKSPNKTKQNFGPYGPYGPNQNLPYSNAANYIQNAKICEGDTLNIACVNNDYIQIQSANWGRTDTVTCDICRTFFLNKLKYLKKTE